MTKSSFFTTAASLTLFGVALISVQGFARGGEEGRQGHSETARMTLLERLDSNADGVLSLDEFSEQHAASAQRHFDKKDADNDELLSLEEFSSTSKHRRHPSLDGLDTSALNSCLEDALGSDIPTRPDADAAFTAADINQDNAVDLDEFLAAGYGRAEQRFSDIDRDSDGQLGSEEVGAYQILRQAQRDAHRVCVAEQLDEDSLLN
ncbi:MAG: EF-hand domain-containing protein [Halioglobus sp.]